GAGRVDDEARRRAEGRGHPVARHGWRSRPNRFGAARDSGDVLSAVGRHLPARGFSMIERYTRPEMGALWTEEARYQSWLRVELAVCDELAERGVIPRSALETIHRRAGFDVSRIAEIEREVRHDVIAFLTDVAEHVGPDARWVHYGMTSSDVIDTALALQIRAAADRLLEGCDRALAALRGRAIEHRHTPMVGRTHGVHAEPTTFGLKLLVLHEALRRSRERLARAAHDAAVGKISGVVGTFAHLHPAVEEAGCAPPRIRLPAAPTPGGARHPHAAP